MSLADMHAHGRVKTWRRARPAPRTACRWGTRSSSSHIWYRWPCDRTPAAHSRSQRPCRCDIGGHQRPAEPSHCLWRKTTHEITVLLYRASSLRMAVFSRVIHILYMMMYCPNSQLNSRMRWSLSEQHIAYYSGGVMVGIEWEIRLQHASIWRVVFKTVLSTLWFCRWDDGGVRHALHNTALPPTAPLHIGGGYATT